MPDLATVEENRKRVVGAYNGLIKQFSPNRQISEVGMKFQHSQLSIDPSDGSWTNQVYAGGRNTVWLVHFEYDGASDTWIATKKPPAWQYWNRLAGSFNSGSPLQGISPRVFPAIRAVQTNAIAEAGSEEWVVHPYWEWLLVYVFPDLAVFSTQRTDGAVQGSSGVSIDLDIATGELVPNVGSGIQPYVSNALFKLVPGDDSWSAGNLRLTYDDLSAALARLIKSAPLTSESSPQDGANESR